MNGICTALEHIKHTTEFRSSDSSGSRLNGLHVEVLAMAICKLQCELRNV